MTATAAEVLVEFLLARITEDELWATEAGRHQDEPLVEGGEHWRWECRDDEIVKPDTDREFMECSHEGWSMSLRSVEQYPYRSFAGEGPSIHLSTDSELRPTVAGHIIRHDPVRVLAECEAKRRIIAEHPRDYSECGHCPGSYGNNEEYPCTTLRATALPYGDHPDYDEAWRP